jgi:hypothetical protein
MRNRGLQGLFHGADGKGTGLRFSQPEETVYSKHCIP